MRSGAILQTDKLFTGQRDEPGDSALGLYNYKARFYSTTLGRFVSADPITKDGLNRYTYVLNNPLKQVDPTGLSALVSCRYGQDCEHGQKLDDYREHVLAYWRAKGMSFGAYNLADAFEIMKYTISSLRLGRLPHARCFRGRVHEHRSYEVWSARSQRCCVVD